VVPHSWRWWNFCQNVPYDSDILLKEFKIPYILESNPHPFYSFRGLKNQMRIIIACRLDSRSRAGLWKNDRAAVRAVRTIQCYNLLFYLLLIIIIYYSSDSPLLLITESLSVLSTQCVCTFLPLCVAYGTFCNLLLV
jgi:hypothetical protein